MENIIAAIDFSSQTDFVLDIAAELTEKLHAKLWIIHATNDVCSCPQVALADYNYYGYIEEFAECSGPIIYDREMTVEKFRNEHRNLNALSAKFKADGLTVTSLLINGEPQSVILDKARELNAKMIVLGSHGHGEIHKILLGSTCEQILSKATCGVLIVPPSRA